MADTRVIDAQYTVDGRRPPSIDRTVRLLWLLSAAFIVYGATIPFAFDAGGVAARLARLPRTTPWALHAAHMLSIPDVVQNILLFVPFGALGCLADRHRDQRRMWLRTVVVAGLGLLLSATVELLQLFTADRISSLTDLITNSSGAVLGSTAAVLFSRSVAIVFQAVRSAGLIDSVRFYPMFVLGIVLCCSAWQPFDVTLDVGTVGHKVMQLIRSPWQYSGIDDQGVTLLQGTLFAGALCGWLTRFSIRNPALVAASAASMFGLALEGGQAFIGARQPGLADAAVRIVSAFAGAWLWPLVEQRATMRVHTAILAGGTAGAAALQMLSPFHLAAHYRPVQWIPFLAYYAYTTFDTVSHTFELLLLYLPLGFLLAYRRVPAMRMGTVVLLALIVAGPIEYLQGWIVGRFPDVTDVGMSAAGALAGWWLATTGAERFADAARTRRDRPSVESR